MITRNLSLDLSSLWTNPNSKFIVRYLDLEESAKRYLAKRIKETANFRTIRKSSGPDQQKIYELLLEINPIIFAEGQYGNSYKSFNLYPSVSLTGWRYENLCRTIYQVLCLKRALTRDEYYRVASLSSFDHATFNALINANVGNNVERERTPIEDISLADVQHATQSAVSNGAGRIPDEMFGYEEAMNIADAVVNNQYLGTTMQPLRTTARERIMAIDPARWTNPTIAIRVDENNNNNNF